MIDTVERERLLIYLEKLTTLSGLVMSGKQTSSIWWEIAVQAGAIQKMARDQANET